MKNSVLTGVPHVASAPSYGGTGRFDGVGDAPESPRRGSLRCRKALIAIAMAMAAHVETLADTWTDPETGIKWTYVVSDGQATVGNGEKAAISTTIVGAIAIPSTFGDYPVTRIGNLAFYKCNILTSVTIPESVTNIGDRAFSECSALTSVTIPDGVTSIGVSTFCGCDALTCVTIPESVTSIGKEAFYGCTALENVTIPTGLKHIGNGAFSSVAPFITNLPDGFAIFGSVLYSYRGECPAEVTIPDG